MNICPSECSTPNEDCCDRASGCTSVRQCCGEKIPGDLTVVNTSGSSNSNSLPNRKLTKSNILDKLHLKLNQLNKLNARVQKCNDAMDNTIMERYTESFKSKMEFENFLQETYNDKRYSYCILNCKPSIPKRQLKAIEMKENRIPRNMGWNWKETHNPNWQPGALPKIIKMRMSHFLNYYPCDTLPITRLNIKLSKDSFLDCDSRESKIKKMIQSMGFSPCKCNKSVAWCMCRDKKEMTKLKNVLEQIEKQIDESGLEYKLFLNELKESKKKMLSFAQRTKSIPDLINQETQYEPMDYRVLRGVALKACAERLSKPKGAETTTAKPNNSAVTIPEATVSKDIPKKRKLK